MDNNVNDSFMSQKNFRKNGDVQRRVAKNVVRLAGHFRGATMNA